MAETAVLTPKFKVIAGLQDLRDQAATKLAEAETLQAEVESSGEDWTEEQMEQHAGLLQEAGDLQKKYDFVLKQMRTEAMRASTTAVRASFNAVPTPQDALSRGAMSRVTHMKANWAEDPQWDFKGHGDFAMAVYTAAINGVQDERLVRVLQYQAAVDHNVPQSGGFLLPPLYNTRIHSHMMGRRTNLMALCDLYPMQGHGTLEMPANAETSRVSGSRWGGVQSYWVEDGSTITDSQPKVRLLELRPRQLGTFIKVNNTMLESPMALEAYLDKAAIDDQIQTINNVILRGDGVAKPVGFLTGASGGSFVAITKEGGQAAATIVDDNVHKMWARVLDEENSIWLVNRDAVPELEAMAATGISGTIPVMLATVNGYPTMAVQGPQTLKGRPIRRLEQCSTLGTVGDLILANMMGYALGYRARGDVGSADTEPGLTKDMSMHLEFDKNRTCFRYLIALDGESWLNTAITPENGTALLSDFVTIETRS
jgi:HK97 family phage major capsid protein